MGEIENYIRKMLQDNFTIEELKAACDPTAADRDIQCVSDLTLGEYLRLIANPDNWNKLAISVDRELFIKRMDEVRNIRNDVMHFDTDPVVETDLVKLRDFVRLMQRLAWVGAI